MKPYEKYLQRLAGLGKRFIRISSAAAIQAMVISFRRNR